MKIVNREFSDDTKDLVKHKYIIDNFRVEVKLQLNKNLQDITKPATLEFPQLEIQVLIGAQ